MKKALQKLFLNEHFILVLIFLNSVLIFVQDFDGIPKFVSYLDQFFTALFTVEMIIKIDYCGFRRYWQNNWNKFDFIVVLTALISLLVDLVDIHHILPLQYILILRVLRLFKSFRIFRFMPNIDNIIKGLQRAVKATYLITFTFIVLLVILSVLTCSIFKTLAPEYFATPLESLYSMFRLFSADSWYEVSDLITSRSTPAMAVFTKIYFILLLFFASILGVSLINSIFVDAMVSNSSDRVEEKVNLINEKINTLIKQQDSTNANPEKRE
ncbi:MAG: ion transporter [Tannerellaceae bacterium]|nr:ion transporter [Tannerellaceae bacterium]